MDTLYQYLDETYRHTGGYWHCCIGGALISSERVVDAEIAIETKILRTIREEGVLNLQGEFKYSDFYREAEDDTKLKLASEITKAIAEVDIQFLVSYARIRSERLPSSTPGMSPAIQIQGMAYRNINNYLVQPAETCVVQTIVDLGISESFKPVYDMYAGSLRSIPMMKARGIQDDAITIANYRRLPRPLFLTAQDSRLLQFSDLLIGLILASEMGELTEFKRQLLVELEPVMPRVTFSRVEYRA
jgi:hypothetical protein